MRLSDIYKKFSDRVQFLVIYIREAHPTDGWWFGESPFISAMVRKSSPNVSMSILDPRTFEERRAVAKTCRMNVNYGIPTYVDDMEDTVSRAYAAKPTRLYLVGVDGRVSYAAGLGPFGFKPDEFKRAIEKYLVENKR